MFVAKHNLAFLNSEHASKLFAQMFPDSEIESLHVEEPRPQL